MDEILFILLVSLLFVHEMDAIRTKEWKMFIILKDMADETAYKIFTLAHLPLYFAGIFAMIQDITILYFIIDYFLIGHTIIHFCFRKKVDNNFNSIFSKTIIYSMGILAIIHVFLLFSYFY